MDDYIFKFLIIVFSIIILLINRFLIKRSISNGKFFTIFEIFNLYFIGLIFTGSVAINVFHFQYEDYFGFYNRPDLLLNIWLLAISALIMMPFGAVVFNNFFQFYPKRVYRNFNSLQTLKSSIVSSTSRTVLFLIFFLCITIIVFFIYANIVRDLAIFHIFDGYSPVEFAFLRSQATNNFGGKFHRYQLFIITLPKLLLVVSYFIMVTQRKWKPLFLILFFITVFYSLINFEKGPLITIFLLIFFAHFFLFPGLNVKKILFLGSMILIGLILMYLTFMGMQGYLISEVLGAIFHRIFIGQVHPLYWWQLYLEQYGTIGFSGFPNPAGIFPFTPVSPTVLIHQFAFPEVARKGIVGSMPTAFFAYPMLSFGYAYSVFSMFMFGFILQFVDYLFSIRLLSNPRIFTIAFYILMMDFFLKYVSDGFAGIWFDLGWVFPLVVCYLYFLLVKEKKIFDR